jgi:hypothetical protein
MLRSEKSICKYNLQFETTIEPIMKLDINIVNII